jgi:hypothetical protein
MQVRFVSGSVPGAHGHFLRTLALGNRLDRLTLSDTHPSRDQGGRGDDGGAERSSDGEQDGAGYVHARSMFPRQARSAAILAFGAPLTWDSQRLRREG